MSTLLATGAFLKNRAGLWQHGRWTASALHGDLATPQACLALEASLERLLQQAGGRVDALAHDLHPDFHSTRAAQALAARLGVPALGIQHHAAHVAVALAQQQLDEPVIGIALDGFGLGDDGQAWGGELLHLQGAHWRRVGRLRPLALPGGDRAAREPWRMAAAALHTLGRGEQIVARFGPAVGASPAAGVHRMLERGLNCPPTSSAGRWFDAAAAALGVALRQADEAEAAIALERLAAGVAPTPAPLACDALVGADGTIDLLPLLGLLFTFGDAGEVAVGARLFHDTLADACALAAARAARAHDCRRVVLGGGCFCNRLLCGRITAALQAHGLQLLRPLGDCGDGALALGQAWLAAQQLDAAAQPAAAEGALPCA